MAIDNTPPRLKLIITIAVITVVTLIGVDIALKSYFAYMADMAQREKLAPTTALDEHKKQEEAALKGAAIPVDQAMAQLAKGTRADLITPQQSEDLGPMTGWSKSPKPAPTPEPKMAPPPSAPEGAAMGDAGAATTAADAGAPRGAADAGAAPGAPKKGGPAGPAAPGGGAKGKDAGAAAPKGAPQP